MSKELNCMNCSIGDFKHELCDCDNGFCKEFKSIGTQEDFFNAVMQRIRPKGDWIPVSERLPEDGGKVLTTYIVNGDTKKKFVETAMHYTIGEESRWWSPWDEHRIPELRIGVVAWQPLPEPYKGGDTE